MRLVTFKGLANGTTFSPANKYLFANLLFLTSKDDDEVTLFFCAIVITTIGVSNASLEALTISYNMQGGCKGEHFANRKRLSIYQSFILYKSRGRQGNVSPFFKCKRGDECFQCVGRSAHSKLIGHKWYYKGGHFSNFNQAPDCHQIILCFR